MNIVSLTFLNVCIQTGSVRNGWKFAVATWTEIALYGIALSSMSKKKQKRMLLYPLDARTIFAVCHFFGKGDF